MKFKVIVFTFLSLFLLSCQQRPIILSTQTSFTLTDGSGFNANTNYTYFSSAAVGSQTEVTFSNDDGDFIKFKLLSVSPANIDIANILGIEINFVSVAGATVTATAGYLNITGSQGSGGNVTSLAGSFQFNLMTTDETTGVGPPGDVGTIKGVFNYVKTQ